jgi:hypothetical protein
MENALDEIKKSANQLQRIIDGIPTLGAAAATVPPSFSISTGSNTRA